jgi:hypothetical protein
MVDISMAGTTISIKGAKSFVNINEFSDDGTPISVSDIEVAGSAMNLNGVLVTWYKPTPIEVSFSLVPGSPSDIALNNFLRSVSIGGKGSSVAEAAIKSLTITTPTLADASGATSQSGAVSYTFTNGRLLRGNPGISSDSEGKAQSRTYTFVFEGVTTNQK